VALVTAAREHRPDPGLEEGRLGRGDRPLAVSDRRLPRDPGWSLRPRNGPGLVLEGRPFLAEGPTPLPGRRHLLEFLLRERPAAIGIEPIEQDLDQDGPVLQPRSPADEGGELLGAE